MHVAPRAATSHPQATRDGCQIAKATAFVHKTLILFRTGARKGFLCMAQKTTSTKNRKHKSVVHGAHVGKVTGGFEKRPATLQ